MAYLTSGADLSQDASAPFISSSSLPEVLAKVCIANEIVVSAAQHAFQQTSAAMSAASRLITSAKEQLGLSGTTVSVSPLPASQSNTRLSFPGENINTSRLTNFPSVMSVAPIASSPLNISIIQSAVNNAKGAAQNAITAAEAAQVAQAAAEAAQSGQPTNTPNANNPNANTPNANTPNANTPNANTPNANTPNANTPTNNNANTPNANTPNANTPTNNNSDAYGGPAETNESANEPANESANEPENEPANEEENQTGGSSRQKPSKKKTSKKKTSHKK
jgi:hypothetical protein